jgi:hypothetical protein
MKLKQFDESIHTFDGDLVLYVNIVASMTLLNIP